MNVDLSPQETVQVAARLLAPLRDALDWDAIDARVALFACIDHVADPAGTGEVCRDERERWGRLDWESRRITEAVAHLESWLEHRRHLERQPAEAAR